MNEPLAPARCCDGCGSGKTLFRTRSVIDFRGYLMCTTCIDLRCEPVRAVVWTINEIGWHGIDPLIRRVIRIYDDQACQYLPVIGWAHLTEKRQLALEDKRMNAQVEEILEDNNTLDTIMKRLVDITDIDVKFERKPAFSLWAFLTAWMTPLWN